MLLNIFKFMIYGKINDIKANGFNKLDGQCYYYYIESDIIKKNDDYIDNYSLYEKHTKNLNAYKKYKEAKFMLSLRQLVKELENELE